MILGYKNITLSGPLYGDPDVSYCFGRTLIKRQVMDLFRLAHALIIFSDKGYLVGFHEDFTGLSWSKCYLI